MSTQTTQAITGTMPETRSDAMPGQIKYILGNEASERFSYYGMKSILVLFMVQTILMTESQAISVMHFFGSAVYFFPLLGGWLSDRFLGKYTTIMTLSIVYCMGHGVLAVWEGETALYVGLGLIALGSGGIKPCVSAHVGDQFTEKNKHLVSKVFSLFYFMINFGSVFATLLIPWTKNHYGHHVAFGIPGILMVIATFIFWMGRHQYTNIPPVGKKDSGFGPVMWYSLRNLAKRAKGQHLFDVAKGRYSDEDIDGAKAVLRIGKVFLAVSVFWALFDQHGSSWVIQGSKMDQSFMGFALDAQMIPSLNPLMVMGLIPLMTWFVYPWFEKKGFKVTPLRKMTVGMFVAAVSFVLVAIVQGLLDQGVQMTVMWQFFPYLVITLAEVLISITGLEFAYTQAPRAMKSTVMSFWLLTVTLGNLITAFIAKANVFEGATFFVFFAALMALTGLAFGWIAKGYKEKDYMQS